MTINTDNQSPNPAEPEDVSRLSIWATAGTGFFVTLGAWNWFSGKAALGVMLGCAIAVANLVAITFIVRGFVRERRSGFWTLLALGKFGMLGSVFIAVLQSGLPWLAVLVGYGTLPIGILASQLGAGRGTSRGPRTLEG